MEKEIVWDKHTRENLLPLKYDDLDGFLSAIDYFLDKKISTFAYTETIEDDELWNWIYSQEDIELIDIKKELSWKLLKASSKTEDELSIKEDTIGKNVPVKVLIACASGKPFRFLSLDEAYHGLQLYLSMENKDTFCHDLPDCFQHLYFVNDIDTSINTLNRSFDEIKGEIIEHLQNLDEYHAEFAKLTSNGTSNSEISAAFHEATKIDCSPQSGRKSVELLKLTMYNEETKQDEEITCELHTKFKKFNIDRTKQDRIYFYPGRSGIKDGKIIIKHIGKHL